MEELKTNNVTNFSEIESMRNFLKQMVAEDQIYEMNLNSISTFMKDGEMALKGVSGTTDVNVKIWPFALKSLEKRSGDTAAGHSMMSEEQIMNSMNNYWPLHKKRVGIARVRGEKLLTLESSQYEFINQYEIFETLVNWLEDKHTGAYDFISGSYSHEKTEAYFCINDSIPANYRVAWKSSGLPDNLLNSSRVHIKFVTDDIAECSAKAIIEMNVGGSHFLLGAPVDILHRNGHGGTEAFRKGLENADFTIKDELNALANLMKVKIMHPEAAVVMALKKAKIPGLSKKACNELVDDMFFNATENAFVIYLFLHGILETNVGAALSIERKLRITAALRTLLNEDWSKFDIPSATL